VFSPRVHQLLERQFAVVVCTVSSVLLVTSAFFTVLILSLYELQASKLQLVTGLLKAMVIVLLLQDSEHCLLHPKSQRHLLLSIVFASFAGSLHGSANDSS